MPYVSTQPIDNPMLCLYSQAGGGVEKIKKPWHGSFGKKIGDGVRDHTGADLLAEPGTKVYACVESVVSKIYTSKSLAGHTIVLKVKDIETFKSLQRDYKLLYADKGELTDVNFNYEGPFYLVFFHLQKNDYFKVGDKVKVGDKIGYSGKTGSSAKNLKPNQVHLHFEVRTKGTRTGNRINPVTTISEFKGSLIVNPKEEDQP